MLVFRNNGNEKKNYFVGFSLLYRATGSVTCHGTLMQTGKIIGDQCSVKKLRKFIDEYYFVALKILIKLILFLAYRENRILLGDPHDLKFKKENLKKILSTNIIE